jgi:hypothetical protein
VDEEAGILCPSLVAIVALVWRLAQGILGKKQECLKGQVHSVGRGYTDREVKHAPELFHSPTYRTESL